MATKNDAAARTTADLEELITRSNQLLAEMQQLIDDARQIRERAEKIKAGTPKRKPKKAD